VTLYAQWLQVPTVSAGGPLTFCAGENVLLTSSSATGNQWYKGSVLIADAINETYTATETGVYTVKVTVNNVESEASAEIQVTVNDLPTAGITNNTNATELNCTTTAISVTATGGIGFMWSTGEASETITISAEGDYFATVTGENGCVATASITISRALIEFSISVTSNNSTCNKAEDGTASVTAMDAQGTVTYLWSNGLTTETITDLAKGTYRVTVTSGSCTRIDSVKITDPARLRAKFTPQNVSCFGDLNGEILFWNPSGGYGTYEYSAVIGTTPVWQSSPSFIGLAPGKYTLSIRDALYENCMVSLGSETITQPAQLSVTIAADPGTEICQGTTTRLTASALGPEKKATYLWSNGATANFINVNTSGDYSVTVTDKIGCTASSPSVMVTETSFVTASVSIAANLPDPVTPASSITFTATPVNGGTNPTYSWRRNGVVVGTNSATYTGTGWTNGESVQCVLTSNAPCVVGSPATSNAIIITIPLGSVKYVISDVTANRVFYYDENMLFLSSSQLSTTALNGVTNAEDLFVTSDKMYILDGKNKRVFRTNGPGVVSTISRPLLNNQAKALNPLSGMVIVGDHLLVIDKKEKAIFRYSLAAAFAGTTNYTALQRIPLNTANSVAEALCYDPVTNVFYVLDNGSVKSVYRYPITSVITNTGNITLGASTRSRPMRTNAAGALSTVTGAVVDGDQLRITDRGLDRSYNYVISSLFSTPNTTNLPANGASILNTANLNSTGISLVNSTTLARAATDISYELNNDKQWTEEIEVAIRNNPATNYFAITVTGLNLLYETRVDIYSETGQSLYSAITEAGITRMDHEYNVMDYAPGMYYVSVTHGTQRKILKLIVLK
jgi:hypothetical protein